MKDVQSQIDERDVSLDQVGIKDFVFPMQIRNKHGEWNSTAANIGLSPRRVPTCLALWT